MIQTYRNPQWYDFNYIGYKKNRHGLDIWEGNYLNKKSSSFLSFMEIQSEISKLIDNYEYTLLNWDGMSGVQLAYQNKVFNKYALFQFMIYRAELLKPSSEIIAYFKEHTDKDEQAHFIQDLSLIHIYILNAEITIYAAQDITIGNHTYYKENEAIQTLESDWNAVLSKKLPVGRYYYVETKTPHGYINNTEKHYFEVEDNQINELQTIETTLVNDRPTVDIDMTKMLEEQEIFKNPNAYKDIVFGIFAREDIYNLSLIHI